MTETDPALVAARRIQIPAPRACGLGRLHALNLLSVAGTAGAATSTVVATSRTTHYGTILISGKTVFTLKPSKVACAAQCLSFWPAVVLPKGVTRAKAGAGVNAARLGTIKGKGGVRQVTYGGKPLYYSIKDTAPGQVNGNLTDEWGKWSVVVTVKPAQASSGGTPATSAGSGGVSFSMLRSLARSVSG